MGTHLMDALDVRLSDGITLAVAPSLRAITTYVALEQETWFEKELAFLQHLLRPGMTAIDIGANVGAYSLAMARLVAPGRVFAYEPASEPRALLERSRNLNQVFNLEIHAVALSDSQREGHIAFGASSELNALAESGPGERVAITNMDAEDAERGWSNPDFVKIDAEGEEDRILAGGRNFFARHSPLVMFEIKAGDAVNEHLRSIFPAMRYRLFRLLAGLPVLVPVDSTEALDGYELNLFAAKPDRAHALVQSGLLVESVPRWEPDVGARRDALSLLMTQAFATDFKALLQGDTALDPDYRDSLAAYGVWRAADVSLPERCAAIRYAFGLLRSLCQRTASLERLSTYARIAWEAGERGACVQGLDALARAMQRGPVSVTEPFWPACPRFDAIAPKNQHGDWFATSALEQFERTKSFSSLFSGGSPFLKWLCRQPFASIEMERRRILLAAHAQQRVEVPGRLCAAAPDHLNAEIWRAGKVPGTSLRRGDSASPGNLAARTSST
jgi:FkbM family methyltransferase